MLGLLRRLAPAIERAERMAVVGSELEDHGLPDGTAVDGLPPGLDGDRVALFVDAACSACHAVTEALAAGGRHLPVVVVPGSGTPAAHYAELAAAGFPVIAQPDGALSAAFHQRALPYAVAIAGGRVVASGIPASLGDLERLAARLPSTHPAPGAADGRRTIPHI